MKGSLLAVSFSNSFNRSEVIDEGGLPTAFTPGHRGSYGGIF
jgi:hypothetical protein